MNLPRLIEDGKIARIINAVRVSLTQNITPLDTASITLLPGEELPARSYVELFNPYGSAGLFRVRSPHDSYGDGTTTAELEHAISEVGDYIVKEELAQMLPADAAMKRVFSHYKGGKWKLGSVAALGTKAIACDSKYERVLDSMLEILAQIPDCMMTFNFDTTPWTVGIAKKGTTVTAEGRLARNVKSATISYDDSELQTRIYYQVFDKNKKATWTYTDASTIGKYGLIEGTVRTSSDMTSDEITATVEAYINDHKEPRISVSIEADELSQITGESVDKFKIGDLMRLNLVDYGITAEKTITSISWADIYNSRSVTVNLGDEEDTVVTFLHNLDAKGSGGGGGGKAKDKNEEKWKEYYTTFDKTDERITMTANRVDKANNILEQAGMELDSKGLLFYAKNNQKNIGSMIQTQADRITLEVNERKSADSSLSSRITVEKDRITQEVTNRQNADSVLSGRITVEANRITQEVTNRQSADNTLSGRITTEANKISLVVTEQEGQNVVNSASIVAGINGQTGSYVKIDADTINLSGYVTASQLAATNANITNLTNGTTTAASIKTNALAAGTSFSLKGKKHNNSTITIGGVNYNIVTWSS